MSPGGSGGFPGRGGLGCGVRCLCPSGGGAPVPLRLQHVCGLLSVPLWEGRQPSVGFSRTIAGCLSILSFTFWNPGNCTPHFFSLQSSVTNRSKCMVQFMVRFQLGTGELKQGSPHENPDRCDWAGFTTKIPAFQLHNFFSNRVSEFWSYCDLISTKLLYC